MFECPVGIFNCSNIRIKYAACQNNNLEFVCLCILIIMWRNYRIGGLRISSIRSKCKIQISRLGPYYSKTHSPIKEGVHLHRAAKQRKLLTRNICLADFFGYQPNLHVKLMYFGWWSVLKCLAKIFAKQNSLLSSSMKLAPDLDLTSRVCLHRQNAVHEGNSPRQWLC